MRLQLTMHDYSKMTEEQNGKCAICDRKPKRLLADHDHKTGKMRQLLCDACNCGLGMFQDSLEVMKIAMDYLKKHE